MTQLFQTPHGTPHATHSLLHIYTLTNTSRLSSSSTKDTALHSIDVGCGIGGGYTEHVVKYYISGKNELMKMCGNLQWNAKYQKVQWSVQPTVCRSVFLSSLAKCNSNRNKRNALKIKTQHDKRQLNNVIREDNALTHAPHIYVECMKEGLTWVACRVILTAFIGNTATTTSEPLYVVTSLNVNASRGVKTKMLVPHHSAGPYICSHFSRSGGRYNLLTAMKMTTRPPTVHLMTV